MTKDRTCGILLILAGIVFGAMAMQFNSTIDTSDPGPKLFPLIGCFGMVACGVGLLFQKSEEKWPVFLEMDGWKKLGIQAAILMVYVFAIKWIGFLICTPVVLYIFTTMYDREKKTSIVKRVVYSVVVTGCVWFLFVKVLLVMLPAGQLF